MLSLGMAHFGENKISDSMKGNRIINLCKPMS